MKAKVKKESEPKKEFNSPSPNFEKKIEELYKLAEKEDVPLLITSPTTSVLHGRGYLIMALLNKTLERAIKVGLPKQVLLKMFVQLLGK